MTERQCVVIGAGVMGRGIAHVAALSGYRTTLTDLSEAQLSHAVQSIENALAKGVSRGKITENDRTRTLSNLTPHTRWQDVAGDAEIIIEAVPESMVLKQQIFSELAGLAPADALLGTNTSSLSISEIAEAAGTAASRVIGTHFFNPVHILTLLELVTARQTSDATLASAQAMGAKMGRDVIVVQDSPGFATSRLGLVIGLEAIRMLEAGVASAADIDKAMELGYRHPMGPLRLTDLVGLDTRLNIAEHLHATLGPQFEPPTLLRDMVAAGKLGKKSGEGFYTW
jgi:3-hydroxybutyryl-CoA dehydrogenase